METTPTYKMRPADITFHYREVCSYLTRHDIDAEARAKICGLAEQTMKQYGALDGTTAHRKIPLATLNLLREAAIEAYWTAAENPYRTSARFLHRDNYIVPTLIALRADGSMCERHPHPLRVRERADNHGGYVIDTTGTPSTAVFDEPAELRSRWRKAAYRCTWPPTEGYLTVEEFLCQQADCCPYSLWRIGTEFGLWAIQPTKAMVKRLENAIRDLEMPEEGVAA
ncbi:hypothetical protein [Pararhizobium sp.]|uniref:hypothetical protein n=1 Tax=Pararhizobium sp. TaxID=1977563 RepID=UPI003D120669